MENIKTQRDEQWRVDLRNAMKAKERTDIERVKMPELAAEIRCRNNEEVNRGLTAEQAVREAHRCLDCAKPTCMDGCPVAINIPDFIKNIERGEFLQAAHVLQQTSALPAVCGRVCPQEKQCEVQCIHLKMKKEPVAIGYLERFAADYAISQQVGKSASRQVGKSASQQVGKSASQQVGKSASHQVGKSDNDLLTYGHTDLQTKKNKIAVAGSGPAGLSFAGEMARLGYEVTVFEALHEIGGVLKYGIPVFRLPNEVVDFEIENLRKNGVKFVTNCIVGKTITLEELKNQGFVAMFVGSGAGLPRFMNIKGENLNGVMSSNEYLTRVNLMDAANSQSDTPVIIGKNVAIIGGGNTAMDSVRTAKRLGADRAMIVYRRSEEEMPARIEEIKHAKEEGIEFMTLRNPIEYIGDEKGRVRQMILQVMELGAPDESGRRSPVEVKGKTEIIDVDEVIVSVGVSPNPLIPNSINGLDTTKWGTVVVDEQTMQTSIPMIFAGGDIVRGGATVILAMGDGRRAAKAMDEWLKKQK